MYKYISYRRIEQVLLHSKLTFSQASKLNDPYELKADIKISNVNSFFEDAIANFDSSDTAKNIEFTKEQYYVRKLLKDKKLLHLALEQKTHYEIIKSFNEEFQQNADNHLGILSLSEDYKNLLMWAHYASSHEGIVIEFEREHEFFTKTYKSGNILGVLNKINYSNKRPSSDINEISAIDVFLTKSIEWEYEKEYRMFMYLKDCQKEENNIYTQYFLEI